MLPCMRPDDLIFEHETPLILGNADGTEARYECRIEFAVASDDAVYVTQVDVWGGTRWQDCRRVEERRIHEALHEKADDMAEVLFDTVSVQVEDRRAEAARDAHELRLDNADDRGHAHRERIAERAR